MESKDLRFFLEVAKTGSFSQAAVNLYSVQSNVTSHIKKIENEYDIKLFNRNNSSVTLTNEGEKLLFYATDIIKLLDEASESLTNKKALFTIGTTASISLLLPEFIQKYQKVDDVNFAIKVFKSEELQNKKYTSNLDCIITNNSINIPSGSEHIQIQEKLTLIYPLGNKSYEEVINDTIIVNSDQSCVYRNLLLDYLKVANSNVKVLEFDSLLGIINSVELGIGTSLIPSKLVENNDRINKISIPTLKTNLLTIINNKKNTSIYFKLLIDFITDLYE